MPPRKKPRRKQKSKWTPDNILTDPKSPLATSDLRTLLTHPVAWTSLTLEDRREILSLFPDPALILDADTDAARPDLESLINDDAFRADCAAYVEDLAHGRHDPQWLSDAWRAHERRKRGEFEEFLRRKFEEDWGQSEAPSSNGGDGGDKGDRKVGSSSAHECALSATQS
ncbi:hypothetical protein E4U57_007663 [Claviceps arundinis]|uniref:DEUBAD domain-containing protein n=1 Tax=Claviceps arundinis TaxID=1623583 RepID=A0A9P7SM54_9HYPO|nr:hypothetical protein E4U57_007663 [Claviceps arundinis]KAG5963772.1 hypothetical protein E4U56_002594 [Claviceps arundinis]